MIEEFMQLNIIGKIVIILSCIPTFYSIKYSNKYLRKYGFGKIELVGYYILAWFNVPTTVFFISFLFIGGIIFYNGKFIATGIMLVITCSISWFIGYIAMDLGYNTGFAVRYSPWTINPFIMIIFVIFAPIMIILKIPYYVLIK